MHHIKRLLGALGTWPSTTSTLPGGWNTLQPPCFYNGLWASNSAEPPALHWSAAPLCLWHEAVAHMAFPLAAGLPRFIESKPAEQNKNAWKCTVFQFVQKEPKQIKSAQAKPIKPPAEDRCNGLALANSFTSDNLGDTLERHPNSQTLSNKARLLPGSIHVNTILENEQSKLRAKQVLERRWMRCSLKWKKWARPTVECNSCQVRWVHFMMLIAPSGKQSS